MPQPARIALPTIALAALLGLVVSAAEDTPPAPPAVKLIIDYGNGVERHHPGLPWRDGLTVLEATRAAAELRPVMKLDVRQTLGRETAMLRSIDGFESEGGGSDRRNWLLWVDGDFADRGPGVYKIEVGAVIQWKYTTWPQP